MPTRTTVLAILAIPAGVVGYLVTSAFVSGLALPEGARNAIILIVPLFISGVIMAVFFLPMFDRMAKRDLAAHRAEQEAEPVDVADDADGEQQPD